MTNYIGENIRAFRTNKGLSQMQLASLAGVSQASVSAWEVGETVPRRASLQPLVEAFPELDLDSLLSDEHGYARRAARGMGGGDPEVAVPLFGSIAAGDALEMMKIEEFYTVPSWVRARHPRAFLLKVRGESMNRVLPNGVYALIDPTSEVLDGKIYAVCIGSSAATIKRVRIIDGGYVLLPDSTNSAYRPTTYYRDAHSQGSLSVIGRVVWYCLPPDFEL